MKPLMTELWFDDQAEDAARYYVETFPNSELGNIYHYAAGTPSGKPEGSVMTVEFTINGQRFQALNGGPFFTLNEATSFIIECETDAEQDYFWEKLSAVPESEQCGWCKDKFGVSWQVYPVGLDAALNQDNPEKAKKATQEMLTQKKLDVAAILKAAES